MAHHRHKREPNARKLASLTGRRAVRLAAGAAVAATLPAVGVGVLAADPGVRTVLQGPRSEPLALTAGRSTPLSRSLDRAAHRRFPDGIPAEQTSVRAVQTASAHRWTTTGLNLWSGSSSAAPQVGAVPAGKEVMVTGLAANGRVEVMVDGASRWVTAGYLASRRPAVGSTITAAAGLSMAPCPDPSVEYRLTPGAVYVYRSVCHAFPQITSYGGWAARGEHADGKAIDIMTSDKALGDQIAAFLQAHAAALDLYDVIWWDRIWTPVRASEGWRGYGNHGSPTANHMDHVHVSVN